jgi:hypothetical protein
MSRWQRFSSTWRLRRFLKRKSSTARAVAHSSGLMEWSDREVARLKPSWARRFISQQRFLARLLGRLTLVTLGVASTVFALSLERFWAWEATAQAVLREEKQVITKRQAWSAVKKPQHRSRTRGPARREPTPRRTHARLRPDCDSHRVGAAGGGHAGARPLIS